MLRTGRAGRRAHRRPMNTNRESQTHRDSAAPSTVALVTGGGRGIGRMVAVDLAKAGSPSACIARSEAELAETATTGLRSRRRRLGGDGRRHRRVRPSQGHRRDPPGPRPDRPPRQQRRHRRPDRSAVGGRRRRLVGDVRRQPPRHRPRIAARAPRDGGASSEAGSSTCRARPACTAGRSSRRTRCRRPRSAKLTENLAHETAPSRHQRVQRPSRAAADRDGRDDRTTPSRRRPTRRTSERWTLNELAKRDADDPEDGDAPDPAARRRRRRRALGAPPLGARRPRRPARAPPTRSATATSTSSSRAARPSRPNDKEISMTTYATLAVPRPPHTSSDVRHPLGSSPNAARVPAHHAATATSLGADAGAVPNAAVAQSLSDCYVRASTESSAPRRVS